MEYANLDKMSDSCCRSKCLARTRKESLTLIPSYRGGVCSRREDVQNGRVRNFRAGGIRAVHLVARSSGLITTLDSFDLHHITPLTSRNGTWAMLQVSSVSAFGSTHSYRYPYQGRPRTSLLAGTPDAKKSSIPRRHVGQGAFADAVHRSKICDLVS